METQRLMVPKWTHQVKVFNDAIKSLEAIKVIADKFDGKVINKRFITKLNEISDRNIIVFSLEEEGYDKIAVAHHLKDQGETILFHLIRGSGTKGLRGMFVEKGEMLCINI